MRHILFSSLEDRGGHPRAARVCTYFSASACAVGVAGIFIETHEDPDRAPSDGPNMIPVSNLPRLIAELRAYDAITKEL